MSVVLTGLGVIAAAAAVSAVGFLVISRLVPERWLVADSEAASALYATIGMAYAILIAIAAIAVWEPRAEADESSSREAAGLIEAHRSAGTLDGRKGDAIQDAIAAYTDAVIHQEWPALRASRTENPQVERSFAKLRDRVDAIRPGNDSEASAAEQLQSQVAEAADARRSRIASADTGLPQPLWPVLGLGGLVSIAFLYLFGLDRTFPNGLMMATVGGMIAAVLFVIYQMEYPFSRGMSIEPDAFRTALSAFTDTGPSHSANP